MAFRVRLRFRIAKPLNTDDTECFVQVAGQRFKISSGTEGEPLKNARWLVANGENFPTEDAGRRAGERLKLSILVSSLCRRVGVDMGVDKPTSGPGQAYAEEHEKKTGFKLRANIHGVDVFPQHPPSQILVFNATGSVLISPPEFLQFLEGAAENLPDRLPNSHAALVLMNAALINPEPLAQLVLSISAVEMLARGETWTAAQTDLLKRLAEDALRDPVLPAAEASEVAGAIARNFRLSIRQGILRLLRGLDLAALEAEWEKIYGSRSRIFTGSCRCPTLNIPSSQTKLS